MFKKILLVIALLILAAVAYFFISVTPKLPIISGFAAKKMCSCTFISDRDQQDIQDQDLYLSPLPYSKTDINTDIQSATTTIFGMAAKTAVYRDDVGCILLQGKDDYGTTLSVDRPTPIDTLDWPYGQRDVASRSGAFDPVLMHRALDRAFISPPYHDGPRTRAVIVVYKDTIVAERYAAGYDKEMPLIGWSMAKSITSALVGILHGQGLIDPKDDHLYDAWSHDDRANITINDLLKMQSGLKFDEKYSTVSDATKMLYLSEDVVAIARDQPLAYPIGSHWEYSSGTTNLLSGIIRQTIDNDKAYLKFPYKSLFNPLGMTSATMESDESGNYVGSSYCYATTRDWAKFGLLYLHDGMWNAQQILPPGWVDYTQEVATHSDGQYGAQFWQNEDGVKYPDAPHDLYSCNGFQGQYIFIIPSHDLVIVRLGLSKDMDFNLFIKDIVDAVDL